MTILLSTQADVSNNSGTNNLLGDFGEAVGIPGFPEPGGRANSITRGQRAVADLASGIVSKLRGQGQASGNDNNFVGSGTQLVVGGNVQFGKVPPLSEGNVRQIYSQTPDISVIIKKRTFSSLQRLNDPKLLDPGELWLLRATKRLVARKCATMADYERLTKIDRLMDLGAAPGAAAASLIASIAESNGNFFTPAFQLEKAALNREPVSVTTYFIDTDLPIIEDFGPGTGTFEITAITSVNTNLDLDGNGDCSFTVEDPYHILFVTEEDIESALRDTALTGFVDIVSKSAGLSLNTAQTLDKRLGEARRARNVSEISFTVNMGAGDDARAVIDAIGFQITKDNLADVPENQALNANETALFGKIIDNLNNYSNGIKKNLLGGVGNFNKKSIREQMDYSRKKLRAFHLGKSIIQPMDSVHIFINGGTRRLGEGENVNPENRNLFSVDGALSIAGNILGLQDQAQIDDDLLRIEWRREGSHMRFADFKKLRTMEMRNGLQVFGGLVRSVNDKYNSESGKYTLNVSCDSNIEWLKLSRYNEQPSLDQTQGIVYDPLTPFKYETDPATGLPIGKPKLSDANQELLSRPCGVFFNNGSATGARVRTTEDMAQDIRQLGGNTITLFDHAPGLKYRWKDGIMTATYDMSTTKPLDSTRVDSRALRRDVGFFASNTAFDNMDVANIISVMVTGQPYNPSTFIQSALNTGAFVPDTSLNSGKDYFHALLDVQRTINEVQGNFVPFRAYNVSSAQLAETVRLQHQLTNKSSRLTQLRTQEAKLDDQIKTATDDTFTKTALRTQLGKIRKEKGEVESELSGFTKRTQSSDVVLRVAGDDITFDLADVGTEEKDRLFGDRLLHATLKRREDVIFNKDKDYLIVSDEYDKDFDVQAFALRLREHSPNLWKSSWQSVYDLCKRAASTVNFELFCNSQGHIVFRPPQYNRTPASVLNAMLSLSRTAGIKVFPDFLTSLFKTREQSLINDIIVLEWEIRLNAALIGKKNISEAQELIFGQGGGSQLFITEELDVTRAGAFSNGSNAGSRESLFSNVRLANLDTQILIGQTGGAGSGTFSAQAQNNLHKDLASRSSEINGSQEAYEEAVKALARLTGRQARSFPEFDKAKIGTKRNGQSTPNTDISNILSKISGAVSKRSKLLRTLERVLEQNIEIGVPNEDGTLNLESTNITSSFDLPTGIFNKLIEDDNRNILGHMSGSRFVIKDEFILDSSFTEQPPNETVVTVAGTDPIVGENNGNIAGGMPLYLAYGVDFDLWRQYGFRGEKPYDKPFFWSAELQCAPYAVMLLSRQRANIVTGSITVFGNEFYQIGDVVYVVDRQLLYYVHKVSHSISYDGQFTTTLDLKYGHSPGDYIPTPLDIIGKSLTNKSGSQNAFRVRRQRHRTDFLLGVIKFSKNSTNLLGGPNGVRNFNTLKKASLTAKTEVDASDAVNSPRVYIMSFGPNKSEQNNQMSEVKSWFLNPQRPGASSGIGISLPSSAFGQGGDEVSSLKIEDSVIRTERLNVCKENFTSTEIELLKRGGVAHDESFALDKTLETVVEIRLRRPPPGGWERDSSV